LLYVSRPPWRVGSTARLAKKLFPEQLLPPNPARQSDCTGQEGYSGYVARADASLAVAARFASCVESRQTSGRVNTAGPVLGQRAAAVHAALLTMPPAEPALISIQQVSMRFGPQAVLREVSLDIARGQTVGIIGESGCGKTVLLKLIIGLMRPTAGKVLFDGRVLTSLSERELTRQRLRFGFLFQGA